MEIQRKAKLRGWIYIHNMHLFEKLGRGWVSGGSAWKGNEGIFFHTNCAQLVWLCKLVDCSQAKLFCLWISQARILEWVAISFSRGSSRPRAWTQGLKTGIEPSSPAWQADSLQLSHLRSPLHTNMVSLIFHSQSVCTYTLVLWYFSFC